MLVSLLERIDGVTNTECNNAVFLQDDSLSPAEFVLRSADFVFLLKQCAKKIGNFVSNW